MAPRRRRGGNRRNGIPAWFWLLGGILIGLGAAFALMFKGYLPEFRQREATVDAADAAATEPALVDRHDRAPQKPDKPRYDFFTVLPEMEVVVPEQELSRRAGPADGEASATAGNQYILQAGSFRSAAEAEQMKAQLALLGSVATVQTVTVNDITWHRVRIGPVEGARKADEMRRLLSENQIETLVMKANP